MDSKCTEAVISVIVAKPMAEILQHIPSSVNIVGFSCYLHHYYSNKLIIKDAKEIAAASFEIKNGMNE
ncbi:unnamed protein product [Brugia timori]|uniref:Uncharacterized protein n=1 Tax=Brugia timori TaxID=42155 RepID=A0A3P7X8L6_9BILA|nr:unnamed protein product [Brugia timori]